MPGACVGCIMYMWVERRVGVLPRLRSVMSFYATHHPHQHQLIEDACFYWLHRLLHHPALYATVHKAHHHFKVGMGLGGAPQQPSGKEAKKPLAVLYTPAPTKPHNQTI